jgi:hypothetical protein
LTTVSWQYVHGWPAFVSPGQTFDAVFRFTASVAMSDVQIYQDIPFGFELLEGDTVTHLSSVKAGETHWRAVKLRASGHEGDHFWRTSVRCADEGDASSRELCGRVVVRRQLT